MLNTLPDKLLEILSRSDKHETKTVDMLNSVNENETDQIVKYEYLFPAKFRFFEDIIKNQFRLEKRNATITSEIYTGVVHFIACLYLLIVIPQQLTAAGFAARPSGVITAACCGIGSIMGGLFSNLPFVFSPNTAISIFYSLFIQNHLHNQTNNAASVLVLSGILLMIFGYRPAAYLLTLVIPSCIQYSVAVGIGLITALAGATSISLIIPGTGDELDQLANTSAPGLVKHDKLYVIYFEIMLTLFQLTLYVVNSILYRMYGDNHYRT